jgi:peptidoglycan/LPS O-acetylase OafA/YrhL
MIDKPWPWWIYVVLGLNVLIVVLVTGSFGPYTVTYKVPGPESWLYAVRAIALAIGVLAATLIALRRRHTSALVAMLAVSGAAQLGDIIVLGSSGAPELAVWAGVFAAVHLGTAIALGVVSAYSRTAGRRPDPSP